MAVHFQHYTQGAPAPGICQKCGNNQDLLDLGVDSYDGSSLICTRCVRDLATFIGWVEEAPLRAEIVSRETSIKTLEEQLAKVPSNVEELINGIRSSVTDFVFAVSYSDSPSGAEPVQDSKPSKPGSGETDKDSKRDDKTLKQPTGK